MNLAVLPRSRWGGVVAERAHLPGKHDQKSHAHGGGGVPGGFKEPRTVVRSDGSTADLYERPMGTHTVSVSIPTNVGILPATGPNTREATSRAELLRTVGDLADRYPAEHDVGVLVTNLVTDSGGRLSRGVDGATDITHGVIGINIRTMHPRSNEFDYRRQVEQHWTSVAGERANFVQYVTTHEWGHAIEPMNVGRKVNAAGAASGRNPADVSGYVRRSGSAQEAFAEAFTARAIGGRGADPFADALASLEGWTGALVAATAGGGPSRWIADDFVAGTSTVVDVPVDELRGAFADEFARTAHLQGKHDQRSHAHGGRGGRVTVDLPGMDEGLKGEVTSAAESLVADYPALDGLTVKYGDPAVMSGTYATKSKDTIYLNREHWTPEGAAKHQADFEGLLADPSATGVINHEAGHILDGKYLTDVGGDAYTADREAIFGAGLQRTTPYGQEARGEAVAEAFSQYRAKGPTAADYYQERLGADNEVVQGQRSSAAAIGAQFDERYGA